MNRDKWLYSESEQPKKDNNEEARFEALLNEFFTKDKKESE